jgi:hypothetical protein
VDQRFAGGARLCATSTLLRTKAYAKCWTPKACSSEDLWTSEKILNFGLGDSAWCSERRASKNQQRRTEPSHVDSLIFGSQTRVVLQASVNNELNVGTLSL